MKTLLFLHLIFLNILSTPPSVCKKVDKAQEKVIDKAKKKYLKNHLSKIRNSCPEITSILNSTNNFILIEMPFYENYAINDSTYNATLLYNDSLFLLVKLSAGSDYRLQTKLKNFNEKQENDIDYYERIYCYWRLLNSDFNFRLLREPVYYNGPLLLAVFTVYKKGKVKSFFGYFNPCYLDPETLLER